MGIQRIIGLGCGLITALALGQTAGAPQLKIKILEGNDVVNYFNQRTAREPIVEVDDENNRPVSGALVLFKLPPSGPGGFFPNGVKTLSVLADANGRATASGLVANGNAGQFDIEVTASYQGRSATALISQVNQKPPVPPGKHGMSSGKVLAIVAVIAAAAAGAGLAAGRGGSNNSSTPAPGGPTTPTVTPTIIVPGGTIVGAPPH
jgi:hypothetical protein